MEAKTLPTDFCIFGHFGWLSPAAVHSFDCRLDSGVKWWIHVSSIVTYLYKNFLLRWNSCKQCSESLLLFLIDCEQTHHLLRTQLSHWQMFMQNGEYILPSDIFSSSAIKCHFNFRSAKMSLWSFLVFSGITVEFGWPEHSAWFVSVWLHLKSTYHLLTIGSDKAESEWHLSSHCFAWTVYFPIRKQCFINTWNLDFSIVLKICNSSFTYLTVICNLIIRHLYVRPGTYWVMGYSPTPTQITLTHSSYGMYYNIQIWYYVPEQLFIKFSTIVCEERSWSSKICNPVLKFGIDDVRTFLSKHPDSNTILYHGRSVVAVDFFDVLVTFLLKYDPNENLMMGLSCVVCI